MKDVTAAYPIPHKVSSELIFEYPLKRSFDFFFATLALGISFPLWFIFAIAIKFEDGGGCFIPPEEMGEEQKTYWCLQVPDHGR